MEAATTIKKMMAGNIIKVPNYQRAYSWEKSHRETFLSDLEEYIQNNPDDPYYFGHFLFEKDKNKKDTFNIIDGQQRLTTIVIFLSALFSKLEEIRELNEEEKECREDMVKRNSTVRFKTVDYDNPFFEDYVINQVKITREDNTISKRRIADAFDFFKEQFKEKNEEDLVSLLKVVVEAECTTHQIENEIGGIQMFLFQNNRGKKPSDLEIIKAEFMYEVHLKATAGERVEKLQIIKQRFQKIYENISQIEDYINEDDVLLYSLRVYFNSLYEGQAHKRIKEELLNLKETPGKKIEFIDNFCLTLEKSFDYLKRFLIDDNQINNFAIHSFISLGVTAIAYPFIIKAYNFNLSMDKKEKLCTALESLVLRHSLIGTRANLIPRINERFRNMTEENITNEGIIERIGWMKNPSSWWWGYWENARLEESLQGEINHKIARYLLWRYEVKLAEEGQGGYKPTRFDSIDAPELEHIAPKKEPSQKNHGYDKYDEDFKNLYWDCLGNYLLVSKSHNCAASNNPFKAKYETYKHNYQQREVREVGLAGKNWDREQIQIRKENIIKFIMETF